MGKEKTLPYSKSNDTIIKSLFGNHNTNNLFKKEPSLNDKAVDETLKSNRILI